MEATLPYSGSRSCVHLVRSPVILPAGNEDRRVPAGNSGGGGCRLCCPLEHAFNCIAVPGSKFDGFVITHRIGFEDTLEMITGAKMVMGDIGMDVIDVVVDAENRDGGAVKICLVAASRQIDFKKLIFFIVVSFPRFSRSKIVFSVQ